MKKRELPLYDDIRIEGLSSDGRGVVRINDIVTFIPWSVPGDVVRVQITRKKSSYMEGQMVELREASSSRVSARCRHFGLCGGCKWQMLDYGQQLRHKQQQVIDAMQRIAKIPLPPILPILGSAQTFQFRNKLEFACSSKQWLTPDQMAQQVPFTPGIGFHITGCFDKVLDITECHLMSDKQNDIRNAIRHYALENNLTFYNEHTHEGLLRNIIFRCNEKDEWMVTVVFGEAGGIQEAFHGLPQEGQQLMRFINETFPEITSLQYCLNTKMNDTIGDLPVYVWCGNDAIEETLETLHFKVGPKSFYQTNTRQVLELYKVVRTFAFEGMEASPKPIIYDLYTGTGTIALFMARRAERVVGIEYVSEAVEDAKENARRNGVENAIFVAGDMKDILKPPFFAEHGMPSIIITDPPRAGMHPDVIATLLQIRCPKIVYVSCNPATQARDIGLLSEAYVATKMQAVDMFPHTPHVENVVLLQLQ